MEAPKDFNKNFCPNCRTFLDPRQGGNLWPVCPKGHAMVHLIGCSNCQREVGVVTDDDYCGPEILICSHCIALARNVGRLKD